MPSVWSWYQSVVARWPFGYWKIANPGPQVTPKCERALPAKKSYHVPFSA